MDILILLLEVVEVQISMEIVVHIFGIQGRFMRNLNLILRLFLALYLSLFTNKLHLYIFFASRYGWVVGVGRYIGQTKGVMYTQNSSFCPTGIDNWRYLNQDLKWMDNGAITVTCAS